MIKRLFFLITVLSCFAVYAQTTLSDYRFQGNLTNSAAAPPAQTLKYYNANGVETAAAYDGSNSWLRALGHNHYLELEIDASGKENLILSFDGAFSSFFGNGVWRVETNNGAGNNFTTFPDNEMNIFSLFWGVAYSSIAVNLPVSTYNKPGLKIRIYVDYRTDLGDQLWLDNLKLVAGAPKISVFTSGNNLIPNGSAASSVLTTDFGTSQVTDPAVTRTYRVRNYQGTTGSQLTVNNITVTGANPGDFVVSPTTVGPINASNSPTGPSASFNISFVPLGDGLRTAEISLYSNGTPNPYTFTVVGVGASCNLVPGTYVVNDATPANQQGLPSNSSANDVIGGTSNNPTLTGVSQLYPTGKNLYTSASTSFMYRGNTVKEIVFGGSNGIDISEQRDVSIVFNLAAFSSRNGQGNPGNSNYGLGYYDYIALSVMKPDNTWSEELRLYGSDNPNMYYRYGFDEGAEQTVQYDGLNNAEVLENNSNTKYNRIRLNLPVSSGITNLKFKISAQTANNEKFWLVDDARIETKNAETVFWNTGATGTRWRTASGAHSSPPTLNQRALILANYNMIGSFNACECEVDNQRTVTIKENDSVKLRGALIVNDGSQFILKSGSNLLQIEDVVNEDSIKVQRIVNYSEGRTEYNFFSSPVANQDMYRLFGDASNTPFVLELNEDINSFTYAGPSDYLIQGKGFAVKDPVIGFTRNYAEFSGVPNNGIVNVEVTRSAPNRGWNLVGNPYPSNVDAKLVYNSSDNIEHNFRFWDNTVNATYTYNGTYGQYSYAILNASTGIGTPAPGRDTSSGGETDLGEKAPNRHISVGQGFMVRAKEGGGTVSFDNAKRTAASPENVFFGKNSEDGYDLFRIRLRTPDGVLLSNTVAYDEAWSTGFAIDDSKHPGLSSLDLLYSMADEEKVIINGRSTFEVTDVVPLGYRAYQSGTYKLMLWDGQGMFASSQAVYLRDKELNTYTDLTKGIYEFETEAGEFTNRFEIVYEMGETLGTDGVTVPQKLLVYRHGTDFVVKSPVENVKEVEVYDMSGRLQQTKRGNDRELRIPSERLISGVYILKITLENGEVQTKKVRKD